MSGTAPEGQVWLEIGDAAHILDLEGGSSGRWTLVKGRITGELQKMLASIENALVEDGILG